MNDNIEYWQNEYQKQLNELKQLIIECNQIINTTFVSSTIEQKIQQCDNKVIEIKETKKSFQLELRMIKDRLTRNEYDKISKQNENEYKLQQQLLSDAKAKYTKSELFNENRGNTNINHFDVKGKGNDELLKEADSLQDKTLESLNRTRQMIENSKEVGTSTIEQLRGLLNIHIVFIYI